jgi:hypothetical protein
MILDHGIVIMRIFILTRNYLHNKIYITLQALRAIAQLVEHLVYTRADVFQGSPKWNQKIFDLIDKFMSYSITLREEENNSLTRVRSV